MKKVILLFWLIGITVNSTLAFIPDFKDCIVEKRGATLWGIRTKGGQRSTVFIIDAVPKSRSNTLKAEVKGNCLEVDSRDFFKNNSVPGSSDNCVMIRFTGLKPELVGGGKKHFMEAVLQGEPAGSSGYLFFEGIQGEQKKHFWRKKMFGLDGEMQTIRIEEMLPGDLKDIHCRFDCTSPGIYRFCSLSFGQANDTPAMAAQTGNMIANGGAERGWYDTTMVSDKAMQLADEGVAVFSDGSPIGSLAKGYIDDRISRSGKHSFRIEADNKWANNWLAFAPVPFKVDTPICFSVWLKADKPTPVRLGFDIASGIGYAKDFIATEQWARYELYLPQWGQKYPDIGIFGDPVRGYGVKAGVTTPYVSLYKGQGKVWIDDAVCTNRPGVDIPADSPIAVRGRLNRNTSYYQAGEPVKVTLEMQSVDNKPHPATIAWKVTDFMGKEIANGAAEQIEIRGKAQRQYNITLPANLRGPFNLNFQITDTVSGKAIQHGFYAGIIDPSNTLSPRLGTNVETRINVKYLIPYLRDFRVGSVRPWANFARKKDCFLGFKNIKYYKDAGIYVMMCLDVFGNQDNWSQPPVDMTGWRQLVKRDAVKYKGLIDAYEILNEPNGWAGAHKNPDPAKFRIMNAAENARTILETAAALHEVDPGVKIAGPSTCHTDVSWTASVLASGTAGTLDIITEHPYRQEPELPDYATDLQSMRNVFAAHGRNYPIFSSECGIVITSLNADDRITPWLREATAYNLRMMIIGYANGVEKFFHFSTPMFCQNANFSILMCGNGEQDYAHRPAPILYAMRAFSDLVGEGKAIGEIKMGYAYRCYVFENDGKRIAVVWKWTGKSARIDFGAASGHLRAFDCMGSSTPVAGTELNQLPVYLVTEMTMDKLRQAFAAASIGSDEAAFTAESMVADAGSFGITIRNRTGKPFNAKVKILTPGTVAGESERLIAAIPGGEAETVKFVAREKLGTLPRLVKVQVTTEQPRQSKDFEFNLTALPIPRTDKQLVLDGDLSAWPTMSPVILDAAAIHQLEPWNAEEKRIRAEMRLAWNDSRLYLTITVFKKDNIRVANSVSSLCLNDSLQVAFDPLKNAAYHQPAYQDDDYEYAVGIFDNVPMVYRHVSASLIYDGVNKPQGLINDGEVMRSIKVLPACTIYQMAFSPMAFSPFRLKEGASMRFNVIVNVNNGKKRIGWLQLTPGIGEAKSPGKFIDLILSR